MKTIQRCSRCVMDNTSDTTIKFDDKGICNYCTYALNRMNNVYFPTEEGKEKLEKMLSKVKNDGKGKKYDCLMGISGGLDSTYLAYLGYKWGLRILAFHIDDGFNTSIAENNIKKLCDKSNIDLIVEHPNLEQFHDITKAFILAGLPGICIPQDNIIDTCLYKNAKENDIRYFLSGSNFSLESVLQRGSNIDASDGYHIKVISKLFGTKGVDRLSLITLFERYIINRYSGKLNILRPLDLIEYNKKQAIKELSDFCGFEYYGGKHYENILTHFAQVYYLPKKFGIDKRTSHLSSLILSGQMTREEALSELSKPLYNEQEMQNEIDFILSRLQLTRKDFDNIMSQLPKLHTDYPRSAWNNFGNIARKLRKYLAN